MNQSERRPRFEEVRPRTYLLKVPFGPVWTGVVLIRGGEGAAPTAGTRGGEGAAPTGGSRGGEGAAPTVLVDSSHLEPEEYLVPALADLGLKPTDIDWLLNTHVHGDHIGGHHALVAKYGLKVACLASSADALRDPVKVAIRVRTRFPQNSPPPQSYLKGVEPTVLLQEGELLAGRFCAFATPGHDDDCVTWVDTVTHTAFTGDSLQANGTPTQGIGFYRDLAAYRRTLAKLRQMGGESTVASGRGDAVAGSTRGGIVENIVCGHDYDGIGSVILGRDAVAAALRYSADRVALYGRRLAEYLSEDPTRDEPEACATSSEGTIAKLAQRLVDDVGCGSPASLFLAMHTVSEHLKEIRT